MPLKMVDGWLWPASDTECVKVAHDISSLKEAIGYCSSFHCAVQAGGNVGIWPAYLADKFDAVYTAEPDADNFACLSANVTAPNVFKLQCGFGFDSEPMRLQTIEGNCGAGYMRPSDTGIVPLIMIDALRLSNVGLIALDIEGMELPALVGAADAINDSHPVVLLEQKGHGRRYGYEDSDTEAWLLERGYHVKTRIARDVIYTWGMVK